MDYLAEAIERRAHTLITEMALRVLHPVHSLPSAALEEIKSVVERELIERKRDEAMLAVFGDRDRMPLDNFVDAIAPSWDQLQRDDLLETVIWHIERRSLDVGLPLARFRDPSKREFVRRVPAG